MNTRNILISTIVSIVVGAIGLSFFGSTQTVVDRVIEKTVGAVVGPDYFEPMRFHSSVNYRYKIVNANTGFSATTTLSVEDSGATVLQATSTGAVIELPAVANAGVHYKFVVADTFATNNLIIGVKEGESRSIEGALIVAGAVVDCATESRINFVADGENVGDFVELASTGSEWVILQSGGLTSAKITCTN